MGKHGYIALDSDDPREEIRERKKRLSPLTIFFLGIFLYLGYRHIYSPPSPPSPFESDKPAFDWDTAKSHAKLHYSPCYDGEFQCARLELPMDYWNDTTDAKISLAVVRRPATVPVTDPRYGGAILINPGGPGGSGVDFIKRSGKHIQEITGSDAEDGKQFDIISFDPRGVGETGPHFNCFGSPGLQHSWALRIMEEGTFESSDAALGRLWAMNIATGKTCSQPPKDGGVDVKKYLTTAYVAHDMLEIVERHGEWREKEAKRLQKHGKHCGSALRPVAVEAEVIEALKYKPGEEKIQYWGFSYGSYLGNTFAAMFPDRINRLIVDGVVDAEDYAQGLWGDNLVDTEKDLDALYFHCARVGFPTCALANKTGETTPEGVKQRMADITASLYHNPLPVIGDSPEVVTYSDIKELVFNALYKPIQAYPNVATTLAQIEAGNGTEFAKTLLSYHEYQCSRDADGPAPRSEALDRLMNIACTDGDDQTWVDKETFKKFIKELAGVSPSIGALWSRVRMNCIHYTTRAVYRFRGPWVAKTSHPLMMIGNTADPVTPLRYAKKMAEGFEGAVALTQDSAGHCSLSTYSNCTVTYVRDYMQTGRLPAPGTICTADELPFGPTPGEVEVADVEVLKARQRHAELGEALLAAGGGFLQGSLSRLR